jgi:hypothetical protein
MINEFDITLADIRDTETRLATYLNAKVPGLNVRPGSAMYDVLIRSMSYIVTIVTKEAESVRLSSSIAKLANKSDPTSRLVLDDLLSNWFIDRRAGGIARGIIKITLSRPYSFTISTDRVFTRGTSSFSLDSTTSVSFSAEDFVESTQNGVVLYSVSIPVKSNIPGDGNLLPPGQFQSDTSIPNLVSIQSTATFSDAEETETNTALIDRARASLSLRGFITSKSIVASINDMDIPGVQRVVTVKAGDKELTRDLISPSTTAINLTTIDSIYSQVFHGLGCSDVVVVTTPEYKLTKLTSNSSGSLILNDDTVQHVMAVYTTATESSKYSSAIPANTIYGTSCNLLVSLSYDQNLDTYSKTISKQPIPVVYPQNSFRVVYTQEGLFNRGLGQATVSGLVPNTQYSVYYSSAPLIDTIDSIAESEDSKMITGSIKFRTPNTCVVFIDKIRLIPNINSPIQPFPTEAIKEAISRFVEGHDQSDPLTASHIAKFVQDNLYQFVGAVDASDFRISGILINQKHSILMPYSSSYSLNVEDYSTIEVVEDINSSSLFTSSQKDILGVSNRSTRLVCRPSNITIQVG